MPDHLSHSFSGQHDSGSSSDESAENGDIAFATGLGLTGPNFVASVNRRSVLLLLLCLKKIELAVANNLPTKRTKGIYVTNC